MRQLKNKKGFSLIEIIVAFAIMMMVIGLSITFFFSSTRTFKSGVRSTTVQNNIQLAVFTVSQQIKLSSDITVLDAPPSEPDGEYSYYFMMQNEDTGKYALAYMSPTFPAVTKTEAVMSSPATAFSIVSDDNGYYLRQTYYAASTSYTVSNDAALLNAADTTATGTGTVLRFK